MKPSKHISIAMQPAKCCATCFADAVAALHLLPGHHSCTTISTSHPACRAAADLHVRSCKRCVRRRRDVRSARCSRCCTGRSHACVMQGCQANRSSAHLNDRGFAGKCTDVKCHRAERWDLYAEPDLYSGIAVTSLAVHAPCGLDCRRLSSCLTIYYIRASRCCDDRRCSRISCHPPSFRR